MLSLYRINSYYGTGMSSYISKKLFNLLVHTFKETMTNHWNLLGKKQLAPHLRPYNEKNSRQTKHLNPTPPRLSVIIF